MPEMIYLLLAIVWRNEGNLDMFTGIVEEVGNVREIASGTLFVNAETILEALEVKDSICINGACLTVTRIDEHGFGVNVVPETLRRTDLGELSDGDAVNLERSVLLGGRLGGHIVQGHVDGTAEIFSIMMNDVASIRVAFNKSLHVFLHEIVSIIILLALLFSISPKLTLLVLLTIPLAGFIILNIGYSIRRKAQRASFKIADLSSIISEKLS